MAASDLKGSEGVTVAEFVHGLLAALNVMVWCRVLLYYSLQLVIGVLIFTIMLMLRVILVWLW